MKNEYRISAKALEDIDKIWLYTLENWSLNQANQLPTDISRNRINC